MGVVPVCCVLLFEIRGVSNAKAVRFRFCVYVQIRIAWHVRASSPALTNEMQIKLNEINKIELKTIILIKTGPIRTQTRIFSRISIHFTIHNIQIRKIILRSK